MRFDKRARIASGRSPRRCRIACQGYGQWLAWLLARGVLDPATSPEARVSPDLLEAFVRQLQERVAPWSVTMMVQGMQRVLVVMAPDRDWGWLNSVVANLKYVAKPKREKRSHLVDARQLYDLGLGLMETARIGSVNGDYHAATMGRDGLLITLLICAPVRIANLQAIEIGRHLQVNGPRYTLKFGASETKTGRVLESELPEELTPWIDFYLRVHRKRLLDHGEGESTEALWISRWGTPMIEHAVRDQIKKRTCNAFGKPIWPHLFRTIAATAFVDHAPEHAAMIPDILGHASLGTSKRHYVLSSATRAHETTQTVALERRKAAAARLNSKERRS
jgi:integrase